MSIDSKLVLQILRQSPQGLTLFEILGCLLAQPQYQGYRRGSIEAQLLPVLESLQDSQVVAHVSPRWVLVEDTSHPLAVSCNSPIEILNLPIRTYHCLKGAGIDTIKQLQSYSDRDLLSINYLGRKSLAEVRNALLHVKIIPTLEVPQLPDWAKIPALQISTHRLNLSPQLDQIVSKFSTVAHLIYNIEAGQVNLDSSQYAELQVAIAPFQALRNAPQCYLDWLSTLPESTLLAIMTKYQWTPDRLREMSPQQILSAVPAARTTVHQAIISGQIPSKRFATIAEELEAWLNPLNEQEKLILKQRLGWQDGNQRSVPDIAEQLKISREIVRRTEQKAKNKLNYNIIMPLQLQRIAIEALQSLSCISTLQSWCEAIAEMYQPGQVHLQSVIIWIAEATPEISNIQFREQLFFTNPITIQTLECIQAQIIDFCQQQKLSDRSKLYQFILPLLPEQISNYEQVASTLISATCYEQLPGIFTANKWKLPDYVYYVLHEAGLPLHFREIGDKLINLIPNWHATAPDISAHDGALRHPDIIRCGNGIYALREWGTMEYHFLEVLLEYLSKQPLPVDAKIIYADLSKSYSVSRATVTRHLILHPNLFIKFGRSNFYGVAGRRYELPDRKLVSLLVAKLESGPMLVSQLEQDPDFYAYDFNTIYLYLNVSPLFCQTASQGERKFALSIDGKRQYDPANAPKIIEDVLNQICEPLHVKEFIHILQIFFAYPPSEKRLRRILATIQNQQCTQIAKDIFISREWINEKIGSIIEDLHTELFETIVLFTLDAKKQIQPDPILFEWLTFCYINKFYYRGSLIYDKIDLAKLSKDQAKKARKIGLFCQRNGNISDIVLGEDAKGYRQIDPFPE